MLSPENNLTEKQSEALSNFLTQFDALRESIPAQLEALSNKLNNVEATMHERLQSDINHVLSQAENGIKALAEEIKTFIDNHVVLKDDQLGPEVRYPQIIRPCLHWTQYLLVSNLVPET
ncbi:unnamed protein product [Mucor fragilis]